MSIKLYRGKLVHRPYLLRNPIISQLLAGSVPVRIFAIKGRLTPGNIPTSNTQLFDENYAVASGKYMGVTSGQPTSLDNAPKPRVRISIVDLDWIQRNFDPNGAAQLTGEVDKASTITLDFIPTTLTYTPSSTMTPIKVLGVNNPTFHFGGSNDVLEFKIDWYGYRQAPVLAKCRFIESLTKADGWASGPPSISIDWGGGPMFDYHRFVVTKAAYILKTFTPNKWVEVPGNGSAGTYESHNLLPVHASQTVVMNRITTSQLTHKEIRRS